MKLFLWFKFFILIILIVWTVTLTYFWRCSSNLDNNNYVEVIEKLHNQISGLEQQYSNIIDFSNLIKTLNSLTFMEKSKNIKNDSTLKLMQNPLGEILRQRTHTNLYDLLNMITFQLKDIKFDKAEFLQSAEHRIFSLIADIESIGETDVSKSWRKLELMKLSSIIQKRIHIIQNPKNCDVAQKLICNLNKGCGFGCQIHHVLYCLILSYSTRRTLILESTNWRYGFKGWEFVFMPLSTGCTSYDKSKGVANWGDQNMFHVKNIMVPIIDTISNRPSFLPQAIPSDIYSKLYYLHSDPFVWFAGQLLSYVMRLNDFMTKTLHKSHEGQFNELHKIGPIVGVHIRRTDKVGTEAQFHSLSEYMLHVEAFFRKEEIKLNLKSQSVYLSQDHIKRKHNRITLKRQIILATDEPNIFNEMKERYPLYHVIGNPDNSRTANIGNRYSQEALKAIIIDTIFLSHTDFLVCTFSSQVCRVAYELMQSHILTSASGDQGNKFKSLDDIYYFGGQHPNSMVMIQDFQNSHFNLKSGDILNVMGNHWNGGHGSSAPRPVIASSHRQSNAHSMTSQKQYCSIKSTIFQSYTSLLSFALLKVTNKISRRPSKLNHLTKQTITNNLK